MVPRSQRKTAVRNGTASCYVVDYCGDKVIQDIAVSDTQTGSWLLLIGTPLIEPRTEGEKLTFLTTFINNPSGSLRKSVDGSFAAFCYDAQLDRLLVATDFNSTVPIFYTVTDGGILFSSHELVLARHRRAQIDPLGWSQAIHLGVTWASETRFQGIQKMLPCQLLIFSRNGRPQHEPYWQPREEAMWAGRFNDQLAQWGDSLRSAVWKYYECAGRRPVICDFTAGEDARLLVAQCHALRIPFKAQVTGNPGDIDVSVARKAAATLGFPLLERRKHSITSVELVNNAIDISLASEGYQEFFKACSEYATNSAEPLDDYQVVKYCGLPGGEAFRGSYYLRGKALFPSTKNQLDYRFFANMKYLLDYQPGLLRFPDHQFISRIECLLADSLADLNDPPLGTQIDHMLRLFQTCMVGLKYRNPLYLPFATGAMTRTIYSLAPHYKRGGKITKARTEALFPDLAVIRTQNGVPTIRKTLLRQPLFLPEYLSTARRISRGTLSRLLKVRKPNKWYYSLDLNAPSLTAFLGAAPYSNWFRSPETMTTGHLYNPDVLRPMLAIAKTGSCRNVAILGRIFSQELACRWVYGDM
jgi:hypothetical protein